MQRELVPHEDEVERSGGSTPRWPTLRDSAIRAGLYAANMPEDVGGGGLDTLTWMLMERELGPDGRVVRCRPDGRRLPDSAQATPAVVKGPPCHTPQANIRSAPGATTPDCGGTTKHCAGPAASSSTTTSLTSDAGSGRRPERPRALPRQAVRSG